MSNAALIHVILKAIDKARTPLLRDFGEVERLQVSQKGTANFVSSADLRTEGILMDELSYARKGWAILSEEAGEKGSSNAEFRFVIDPIDGTSNFIHAIPYFCISIAAQKRNADGVYESIVGVIADPIHDELFIAEAGIGATVNKRKLRVAAKREHLMTATSAPRARREDFEQVQASMNKVAASGATVRCLGAAALDLAYVAAGRLDAAWYYRLKPWDLAAGELLVREAGGCINRIAGQEASVIASSSACEARMLSLLQP